MIMNRNPQSRDHRLGALRAAPRVVAALLALVLTLALAAPSMAQVSSDVQVSFTADEGDLRVGDPVDLTLQVTYPLGFQVILPRVPGIWGSFEVRSQSPAAKADNGDGTETISQTIEVALFAPGTFETPELSVTLRDPAGQISEQPVPAVSLTVGSVLVDGDTELRDIKPQAEVPVPPIWPWVLGALVLAGLAAAGLYLLSRRRSPVPSVAMTVLDTRSAYEIAQEELDHIEKVDLPAEGRFKEHYTLVADCVRRYLEGAHQVTAIDQTTEEVRLALRDTAVSRDNSGQVIDLLTDCDLVKFAKHIPEAGAARRTTGDTRRVVDAIRPDFEAAFAEVSSETAVMEPS